MLACAAGIMLIYSAAGSARAALTYISEYYTAQVEVSDIGVTLVENGADISRRDYTGGDDRWNEHTGVLVEHMLDETDGRLLLGRNYKEELTVRNSGKIHEYVRVRVFRSWTRHGADGSEEKMTELSPKLIDVNFITDTWILDKSASTAERTVLYYPYILKSGETAPLFADTLRIDGQVASKVTEERSTDENGHTTITTTYAYDGVTFNLEAEVDAVQTHNAAEAIRSAWGVELHVAPDGTLSL